MQIIRKFARGYMQTMLFGIEERPKFKMDGQFYFLLHLINHFQYLSIIINSDQESRYSDFKMDYAQSFFEFFLLNNTFKQSMTYNLAMVLLILSFCSQIILVLFLGLSTFIRIYTANLIKRDINGSDNMNSTIQLWVLGFNETLHWFFVLYPVIYLQIAVISFSSIKCNKASVFPSNECNITIGIQILAIIPLIISYIHGQILIYIMRNHRFHEPNSLKRRYSSILLLNNTVILVEVFSHYIYDFSFADILKYCMATLFALNQVFDQLSNFPYRDPIRIPSIRLAFAYAWIVIAIGLHKLGVFSEQNIFFAIVLPLPGLSFIGETISAQLQHHAIINYNSNIQIEEKHIIIAVDQFYKFHLEYQKDQWAQLQYFQFLMIHRLYCKNNKCYSKQKKFDTIDKEQKKDLNVLTLSIIKCIFKAAQNWLFSMYILFNNKRHNQNIDLQFEQLLLQYVSFVSEIAQKPLIGYLELRQYQNNKLNNNSTYFVEITNKLADQLKKQITDNQTVQNKKTVLLHEQRTQLIEISLAQQWQTQNLYENLLQTYIYIVDQKMEHWQNLLNGYPSLNPFQSNTQILCQKIMNLKIALDNFIGVPQEWFDQKSTTTKGIAVKKLTHAQLNINVITLKLYSLFYALVMNDYDRSIYVEQYIKDLTSNDKQKEIDIIDNIALYNDSTTIILVSIVKSKGKIVNKNQLALANFFHYLDANEFKDSVESVHNLLPKSMIKGHEYLIDSFVQKGYSEYFIRKITGYYENKKGFIEKCYVKLGNLFEEIDDYVITASILKCNISNQIVLVDQEGKIIGMSEELFNTINQRIPGIDIEFFKDCCHFFLIFPQFLQILNQNLGRINEIDHQFVEDEEHLFYIPHNLVELNSLFIRESYEKLGNTLQDGLDSQNLSSWRSWKTISKSIQSDRSYNIDRQQTKILGQNVNIADKKNIQFHYQFMNQYKTQLQKYSIIRTKIKMSFQLLKVKRYAFPYFIIELEHMNEISNNHKFFSKYPTMEQNFEVSSSMFTTNLIQKSFNDTVPSSQDKSDTKGQSEFKIQLQKKGQFNNKLKEDQIRQMIQQDDSNILQGNEYSQIRLVDKSNIIDIHDISIVRSNNETIIQKNTILSKHPTKIDQENEWDEFNELKKEFNEIDQLNYDQRILDEEKQLAKEKSAEDFKDRDDSQQEIQENLEIHSSNQIINIEKKNDLIEILKQNRKNLGQQGEHIDEEEENKKRSIASTSRTSTSKSPSLLIRSLYQVTPFTGSLKPIIFALILFLILQICLVFVKLSLIQNNYDILQTNINYVTYPETLNFYFQKIAYFSWITLQSKLDLITYSEFIQKQSAQELLATREVIDVKLNELYRGIIQYEEQIMNDELKLISINDMAFSEQQLDLTQLIQQIQLHAFNYMDNYEDGIIYSDSLFFRLNIPYVYKFAYKYITLLNENLIYYEDRIINDIIILTMVFLGINTLVIFFLIYQQYVLTQYERQILMLITRVSHKSAEDIMQKLLDVKTVLIEPSQLIWKRVNYFEINYENLQQNIQVTNLVLARTQKSSSIAKSSDQTGFKSKSKSKRSYQSNSLAQRIYDLSLIYPSNFLFLFIIWLLSFGFILGGIMATVSQVSDIKPTLDLNLQLIRFKLRFDTLIVLGEVLKTQQVISDQINAVMGNMNIDMKTQQIIDLFSEQTNGFQDYMRSIYDSLAGQNGLLESQKQELLTYFEDSLCNYMSEEIPFCQVRVSSQNFTIPQSFIDEFGEPWPEDNNYDYLSSGITGCVQEFTKTLNTYFSQEIEQKALQIYTKQEALAFLQTQIHINQFVEYFLDSGKLLTMIGDNLFEQNQSKLQQATTIMQLYIYITGLGMVIILSFISYIWLKYISNRLRMTRLSLTLIPYEILLEPKTMSSLKQL